MYKSLVKKKNTVRENPSLYIYRTRDRSMLVLGAELLTKHCLDHSSNNILFGFQREQQQAYLQQTVLLSFPSLNSLSE